MLKNFWYACENSAAIADAPVRVRILGQDIVLFRDEDSRLVALSDLCVHRGAALSKGWVEGSCVVCPYHGWKFAADGACVDIPANKTRIIPKRARVDTYPVLEKYGWAWVFLGDLPAEQRPPIPTLDVAEQDGWAEIRGEFTWNAHYSRVVENAVDIAHAPFVHRNSFGNIHEPEVDDYEVVGDDYEFSASALLQPPRPKGLWKWLRRQRQPVKATVTVYMPNITRLDLDMGKWKMTLVDANIPVDDSTTLTKYISYRNFFRGRWANRDARRRVNKIFLEDQPTVESIRPELLPYRVGDELHLSSDAMGIAYRKRRNAFLDRGWGIDTQALRELRGRKAAVIPSPDRRTGDRKVWVISEVPSAEPNKQPAPGGDGRKEAV
jgi:phenylpropionate dioxygenase-like ring-hydroxylating dioxygenase large terminal subunit